jgi:hypothetical protein
MGRAYSSNFSYLPSDGTRGGILLACRDPTYQFSDVIIKDYTITFKIVDGITDNHWSLTGVYGP